MVVKSIFASVKAWLRVVVPVAHFLAAFHRLLLQLRRFLFPKRTELPRASNLVRVSNTPVTRLKAAVVPSVSDGIFWRRFIVFFSNFVGFCFPRCREGRTLITEPKKIPNIFKIQEHITTKIRGNISITDRNHHGLHVQLGCLLGRMRAFGEVVRRFRIPPGTLPGIEG